MNNRLHFVWRSIVLGLFALWGISSVWAQGNSSLRINEVMVTNTENLVDEYGKRSAWIEFYNPTAAKINIGGMFLTDDPATPTKYPIRAGNHQTQIAPYHSQVIFLDGLPQHGTLHSGLTLDPYKETTVYLYDGDGKQLIDQVTIPAGIPANHSYARVDDGAEEWGIIASATPRELNKYTLEKAARIAEFQEKDPSGIGMTLIAVPVVFLALIIIYLVLKGMGKVHTDQTKKRVAESKGVPVQQVSDDPTAQDIHVAIAMALYETMHSQNLHDEEDLVLTIHETKLRYSPWSSKRQSLRQLPERRY